MSVLISFMIAWLTFLLYLIVTEVIYGVRTEPGFLKKYYATIQGHESKRVSFSEKLLRLNKEQRYYAFNTRRYLTYALPVCIGIILFMIFFFRSWPFALIVSLIGLLYPRFIILAIIKKRRILLGIQLKDAMYSLVSSLRAGASLHTAIERCVVDMERIYRNVKDPPIVMEFRQMSEELQMGFTVEETLIKFMERVNLEDVSDFVNATLIAKKRGGNLTEILSNISKTIADKIEIKQEIDVLTAGKQMEARVLSIMPIFIVSCLTLLSPEYMAPLYDSFIGKSLLFIGFILVGINYFISRKIVDIHV